jgi:hypothetical protein
VVLKKPLKEINVPSTSFSREAYWDGRGAAPAIRFLYKRAGVEYSSGFEFHHVAAMRKRAERCCTAWHVEGAYDTLVEVEGSDWGKEILADTKEGWKTEWEQHHYMIYLDSTGCFEVIAASWNELLEQENPPR